MKIAEQSFEDMQISIQKSHERSKNYLINLNLLKASEDSKLNSKELEIRILENNWLHIAIEKVETLYSLLKGSSFCMVITDSEGYVLHILGDNDIYLHFKERNCMPGYRWTEKEMGTCAIGLTLVEQKPIFIPGSKMYTLNAKSISNAGAPIFGKNNEFLGVICISGYSELMHLHTLGLVCQAAEAIKSTLKEDYHLREMAIRNKYLQAFLGAGTRGIIIIDQNEKIVQTNQIACDLLDLPTKHIGKIFSSLVKTGIDFLKELKSKTGFLAREFCTIRASYFLSLTPVFLDKNEMVGAILTIAKKNEMVELAMEIAGVEANFTFQSIIGKSKALNSAIHLAKIASKNGAPVLILGETGTGKELFAQAIHNASDRKDKPFLALNCGAIPKELLESELFGYEEGAFTGAQKGGRAGKLEIADTGTLFLDEIGDMPFDMQVKLLRVLQTGELRRVGSVKSRKVDLRVISATNKNLIQEVQYERFRPDLFYRISTLYLTVPPLKDRDDDIILLIDFFMKRHGYSLQDLCPQAKKQLEEYHWPGNVRQLENMVERAIHLAQGGSIKSEHLILHSPNLVSENNKFNQLHTLDYMESEAIKSTIIHYNGNLSQAAKSLGISRPTLYRKAEKYKIAL